MHRILFITLSNIGDAIMTTPVLQSLHALYPEAVIDIVADRRSSELFLHCPFRGNIFQKDKHRILRGLPALVVTLWPNRYDLVVDLRTEITAWLIRADRRLCRWHREPYGPHSVERHMGVIRSLHGNRPIPSCVVWTGDADRDFAARALQEHQGKKLLAIGAGANWAGKRWPPEHFLALIERLQQHYDAVVFLGNEKDQKIAGSLKESSPMPCINLCGKTSLLQAAAVLQKMSLFVGNDSGLGHLASAVNTPSVTVFGPFDPVRSNPERYRPWGAQARYVTCTSTGIEKLSPDEVLAQINKPA